MQSDLKIIRFNGGLGNQMFLYAFYMSLKVTYSDVKIDLERYGYKNVDHNGYELNRLFNLSPESCSNRERNSLIGNLLIRKIYTKLFGVKKVYKTKNIYRDKNPYIFDQDVFLLKGQRYIQGYWQSAKYFKEHENLIRTEFAFPPIKDDENMRLIKAMNTRITISVHIRRGDYLNIPKYMKIGNLDYYNRALNIFKEKFHKPLFIFFSDDIDWVKENLNIVDSIFVDWNKGDESFRDMQLMSLCNHNIITISSFSWWGAWLNNHNDKIVIAPGLIDSMLGADFISRNWIKL